MTNNSFRDEPVVPEDVRKATHELKNAAARLQSAVAQIRREADAITELVHIMHGEEEKK